MDSDVLIVGAGATGGALAGRLSEMSDRSVLVLEGGPVYESVDDMPRELLQPSNLAAAAPGHPNNWAYMGEATPGLRLPYPRGKGLGGSSSINGCYFIRGTVDDFDYWAKLGNDEWTYEKVLPFYKKLEADQDFGGEYHGTDGPIPVKRDRGLAPEITSAFDESCIALGFPRDPDKNTPSEGGVGPIPLNVANGRRVGTALGYLLPNLSRPNLRILGEVVAERLVFEGTRAVGVEALHNGRRTIYRANEIVISAGALRTPQILMLSGIGPADHLRQHGIDIVEDVPGVGQNLMDHPLVSGSWDADAPLSKDLNRGSITSALHWHAEGSQLEIFPFVMKNGDMFGIGDVLARPGKALTATRGTSVKAITRQVRLMAHAMLGIAVLQEDSRGTVTLASSDPHESPVIKWNLLAEATDRARFREAVRVANEIFQQGPLRSIGAKLVGLSSKALRDDKALDEWVEGRVGSGHPSCTCRMGPESDPLAVVDQRFRVYGVEGLRVADTSVFPSLPSRGPNCSAIMLGERAAEFLR